MFTPALLSRAEALLETCRVRGIRVVSAESCTGGLVTGLLTEIPGSSDVVDRGFVTYTNEAKSDCLGVPVALIAKLGAEVTEISLPEKLIAAPIMFKLTPPSVDDFYRPVIEHPKVLRVVALSGGYSREEPNAILARNHGLIASFSRALTEGLTESMSAEEFDALLAASIRSIYAASIT